VKEKDLEDAVIDCFHRHRWRVAHFSPAPMQTRGGTVWRTPFKADGKGFFDLVAVRERLLIAELKLWPIRMKPEQKDWHIDLLRAGVEVHIWTDRDWFNGTIEEVVASEKS
jgi:hypothetical protein